MSHEEERNGASQATALELDQQVDGQGEEVAHGVTRTTLASACKTAPQWRIRSYYDFATHTLENTVHIFIESAITKALAMC